MHFHDLHHNFSFRILYPLNEKAFGVSFIVLWIILCIPALKLQPRNFKVEKVGICFFYHMPNGACKNFQICLALVLTFKRKSLNTRTTDSLEVEKCV